MLETTKPTRNGSVTAQIEDIFFENYLKFFKLAEEKRRWSIDHDIPWDKVNPDTSDLTAHIVQSFSAVEMYLPDYTSRIMELIRRSRGRAWFQANWGYEESKHSMVLEEWLLRSGKRTEEQVKQFVRALLGEEWKLPFDNPRQMIIYTMIQELATRLNYLNLRERARQEGDQALFRLLGWVAADESAHFHFFRQGVQAYLEREPDDTLKDINWVFKQFDMPAQAIIPDWEERGRQIEEAGIFGPRMFVQKVREPILKDLGIDRKQLKQAGMPADAADRIADAAEERAEDAASARLGRAHSVPAHPAPLSPAGRKLVRSAP